jgi:N-carbamoyl-L-amino-acid hydrolase
VSGGGWSCAHPLHAYLELHIEQGPVLERQGVPLGVVTAIAGIERVLATFVGRADHAGTTPMEVRHDALVAAAKAVLTVEREGLRRAGARGVHQRAAGDLPRVAERGARTGATVGGVPQHRRGVAVRGAGQDHRADRPAGSGERRAGHAGLGHDNPVVDTDQGLQNLTAQTAESLGYPGIPVASGATHDAVHLSRRCPTGMIQET